jgi:type II secretory pathway component GspD/PulD (secretin)
MPTKAEPPTPLDTRIQTVNFDAVPLEQAINTLRDQSGENIFVNWRALEHAGITRAASVTARMRDVSLGAALRSVCASASGGRAELGTMLDDKVITVSTAVDLRQPITRVYDVRDLLVPIPDFEPTPDGGAAPIAQPSRADMVDRLTKLIQDTVEPEFWTDMQNPPADLNRLRELAGQFIITATPQAHQQIQTILNQLRETRAVQIALEMRFIAVDPDKCPRALLDKLRQSFGDKKANATKGLYLTEEQASDVIRAAQKIDDSTMLTAPRMTLFNGQRAYITIATSRAFVSSYMIVQTPTGDRSFQPQISTVSSGITIDTQATATPDRKNVTVTLRPKLTKLLELKSEPFKQVPKDANDITVQVPTVLSQSLNTTVSIPDQQTMILGGLVDPGPIDGKPIGSPRPIYLLVKPRLIVQHEVAAAK